MSKKQVEEIEVNDEMVVAAATDINAVLKPEPLLDLKKPGEELQKDVEELFPSIMKGDALSKETWEILTALGWEAAEAPKIEKPKVIKPANTPKAKVEKAVKASKTPKAPKEKKGPSNKAVVYGLWAKGKGESDSAKLFKKVSGGVKESTIRSWINQWKKGTNLPGCATK